MTDPVLQHFADQRPDAVARHLGSLAPRDIGAFLATLEPSSAARILTHLSSQQEIDVLASLRTGQIAGLLLHADRQDLASVITHLPSTRHRQIIEQGSEQDRKHLERLLASRAQTVAQRTSNRYICVTPEQSCASVQQQLATQGLAEEGLLVVTEQDSAYLGILPLSRIMLSANSRLPVRKFVNPVAPLSGAASIDSVIGLSQWLQYPVLPVVDESRRFIGVAAIANLQLRPASGPTAVASNPLFHVLDTFIHACAETFEFLLTDRRRGQ